MSTARNSDTIRMCEAGRRKEQVALEQAEAHLAMRLRTRADARAAERLPRRPGDK
jgi:hypothetical protein